MDKPSNIHDIEKYRSVFSRDGSKAAERHEGSALRGPGVDMIVYDEVVDPYPSLRAADLLLIQSAVHKAVTMWLMREAQARNPAGYKRWLDKQLDR